MARRTGVKRIAESDDDVEMTESFSSKKYSNPQRNDYPTPASEQDSQNGLSSKLSSMSFPEARKVSDEPRKLLSVINDIEALGIRKQDLDVPKIVAIGDQSAGKSSAIAAISGITVPRNAGLCTRCPTHITLRVDATWKCNVSLERKYYLKRKNDWEALETPNVTHFMEVVDLDHLENVLSRAQAAMLNPSSDPKDFASSSVSLADIQNQSEFSPNLIRLEISGPDCPELTFYDLPGVFNQTSKKEHQHLPQQIRKLVTEYIHNKNHILLLACPMNADAENSSAGSMVTRNAEARTRSIGLLTKPDLLPEGNPTSSWKKILQGNDYQLEFGYFVTKQPSQKDLNNGVGYRQARENEESFFQHNEPWSTEFATFREQFGTEKLQSKLSEILVAQIRAKIPQLIETVELQLENCTEQLSQLPTPPHAADMTVLRILTSLQGRLRVVMQGELPHNGFIRKWMKLSEDFSQAIYSARPTLIPTSAEERKARILAKKKFEAKNSSKSKPIALDDEDEEQEDVNGDAMIGQKRSMSATPSPTKRARLTPSSQPAGDQSNRYALEDIREIRIAKNTSAIGSVDHRADEHIIMNSMKLWHTPLSMFVEASRQALKEELNGLVEEELQKWHGSALYHELLAYASEWVSGAARRVEDFGQRVIDSESVKPMTVNLETKQRNDEEETKKLRSARRGYRANLFFDNEQVTTNKPVSNEQRQKRLSSRELDDNLGKDPWEMELEIMGRVRGYYAVASSSFVDTVCKIMRLDMFERCKENLIGLIENKFKLNDPEGQGKLESERLLAEDEGRANQRLYFQREKEKYEKAKKSLEEVCR